MKSNRIALLIALPVFCAVIFKGVGSNENSEGVTVVMENAFAQNEIEGITATIEAPAADANQAAVAATASEQVVQNQAAVAATASEQVVQNQAAVAATASEQVAQDPAAATASEQTAASAATTPASPAAASDPNTAVAANTTWVSIGHEDIVLYPAEENANNTNAQVACGYINGYVVKAGETFSYATTIGQGTPPERGYVIAHVVGGYDYGGGVCKISSALYHAAANAGCKIIERHNHTQPVDYYAPGDDAAIAYKSRKDFRFRNDYGYDIMIQASYDEAGYHVDILAPQI
ncbi:VanW like protein [Butyrivibrio sp. Su6]|uniref:VanW family protein n=1 Tax=Butyrivibrio sp. Su6 TaxID=1520810 RepID=UPI00089F4784|nr:VanW family protein [Butyrivibrio sp. Su6]SEF74213.1 VanW like protein [Butyrivibrio sp. Su6]